jgi:hypothetical protein
VSLLLFIVLWCKWMWYHHVLCGGRDESRRKKPFHTNIKYKCWN